MFNLGPYLYTTIHVDSRGVGHSTASQINKDIEFSEIVYFSYNPLKGSWTVFHVWSNYQTNNNSLTMLYKLLWDLRFVLAWQQTTVITCWPCQWLALSNHKIFQSRPAGSSGCPHVHPQSLPTWWPTDNLLNTGQRSESSTCFFVVVLLLISSFILICIEKLKLL